MYMIVDDCSPNWAIRRRYYTLGSYIIFACWICWIWYHTAIIERVDYKDILSPLNSTNDIVIPLSPYKLHWIYLSDHNDHSHLASLPSFMFIKTDRLEITLENIIFNISSTMKNIKDISSFMNGILYNPRNLYVFVTDIPSLSNELWQRNTHSSYFISESRMPAIIIPISTTNEMLHQVQQCWIDSLWTQFPNDSISSLIGIPLGFTKYRILVTLLPDHPGYESQLTLLQNKLEDLFINRFIPHIYHLTSWDYESQILYHRQLEITPQCIDGNCYILSDQLPFLISTSTWYLDDAVSNDANTINLLVWIVTNPQDSLYIRDSESELTGYCIPQWGGFMIHHIHTESFDHVVNVLTHQFKTLLHIPPSNTPHWSEFSRLTTTWMLHHTKQLLDTARYLDSMIDGLPHMPIQSSVADKMQYAVDYFRLLTTNNTLCNDSSPLYRAYSYSIKSLSFIESAFFDPSMIPQAYFPEMHIYAVYLPLFLPFLLAVFVGVLRFPKIMKQKNILHNKSN